MKNTRTLILVFLHIVVTNFINLLCAQLRGSGFVNIHSEMQQPVVIFISSKTNCQIAIGLCSLLGHSAFDDSFSAVNDWGVFSMLLFASCSSFFPASTSAACQFRCLETMNSIWWMSHSIPNDMLRSFVHFISLSYIHITHKLWSLFDEGESERCRRKCVNFVTSVNINSKNEKVTNKKKYTVCSRHWIVLARRIHIRHQNVRSNNNNCQFVCVLLIDVFIRFRFHCWNLHSLRFYSIISTFVTETDFFSCFVNDELFQWRRHGWKGDAEKWHSLEQNESFQLFFPLLCCYISMTL